ncbi:MULTISPECIES: hypothetical protein [Streptomyces]|uniref:hypothetical protein n=1 Tax=Streptomyces TaxID=1883 RepID=UPI00142DAE3A|nr:MULTISPECIES: hypothetical protein [Streptomyces]
MPEDGGVPFAVGALIGCVSSKEKRRFPRVPDVTAGGEGRLPTAGIHEPGKMHGNRDHRVPNYREPAADE